MKRTYRSRPTMKVFFLWVTAGGRPAPVLLPGEPARQRLPAGGRRPQVVERAGRRPAEAAAPRGAEQDPGPPALAAHQGTHRGEERERTGGGGGGMEG